MKDDIIIPIDPMGAVRLTQRSLWTDKAKRYASYKEAIRLHLGGYELPEELILEFRLPMPKSWSQKKRQAMKGQPHKSRPDTDNLIKSYMDAFGVEDSHVWNLHVTKRWDDTGSIIVKQSRN